MKKVPCEKALIFWNEKDIAREVFFFYFTIWFSAKKRGNRGQGV